MSISPIAIALLSGLTGALIIAVGNFFVNLYMANRRRQEEERQAAFVYLVRISELLAFQAVVGLYLKILLKPVFPDLESSIASAEGKFDASHAVCVRIAEIICEVVDKKTELMEKDPDFLNKNKSMAEKLREVANDVRDYKIPDHLLTSFPREAVVSYSFFVATATAIRQDMLTWADFLEKWDKALISPETIHRHWNNLQSATKSAQELRAMLVHKGRIPQNEAANMLRKQMDFAYGMLKLQFQDEAKIEAAMDARAKQLAEQSAVKAKEALPQPADTTTT